MIDICLPLESQKRLIEIARLTLDAVVQRHASPKHPRDDPYLEQEAFGAFVTLFNQAELRGCVGTCTPSSSLRGMVVEMTEAAATRDHRVKPVRADELDRIHIDVSVLSPLKLVREPLALQVGLHGLHIAHGGKRAVFLPQVAVEQRWNMQTFLEQTCVKANLPKDAWRWTDTVLSTFTALIIEEER